MRLSSKQIVMYKQRVKLELKHKVTSKEIPLFKRFLILCWYLWLSIPVRCLICGKSNSKFNDYYNSHHNMCWKCYYKAYDTWEDGTGKEWL